MLRVTDGGYQPPTPQAGKPSEFCKAGLPSSGIPDSTMVVAVVLEVVRPGSTTQADTGKGVKGHVILGAMSSGRLEAFSDGVIAILITIMVLELHVPAGSDWAAIRPVLPVFLAYVLSFVFLGIYWNNHHHTLSAIRRVSGAVLWANLHLLFWLSLVPFATRWMDEANFAPAPTAAYGIVLLLSAVAYTILVEVLIRVEGRDSAFAKALGNNRRSKVSLGLYVIAIPAAFAAPPFALALYASVALIWLIPDRRFERSSSPPDSA